MLRTRSIEPEEIDDPDVASSVLIKSLDFMVFVNRFLGGTRTILDYFEKNNTPNKFTVLDLGSGGGDIPFSIVQWARKKSKQVFVTAIDLNPVCREYSRKNFDSPDIHFLQHSAFDLESLGQFDYITSSMFFHHLSDTEIVGLLRSIERQCRVGFIINDLYRSHLNHLGAAILSGFTFDASVINDATLSVRRGFRKNDFLDYRIRSGTEFSIERKPVFRITMSRHDHRSD